MAAGGATQRVPPSFCSIVYNGDGGQTVCVERGGSSPAPSWRESDSDAPHPGPESALRYLGNERWNVARARRELEGHRPAVRGRGGAWAGVEGLSRIMIGFRRRPRA